MFPSGVGRLSAMCEGRVQRYHLEVIVHCSFLRCASLRITLLATRDTV